MDYSVWSPERDSLIPAKYSAKNLEGKMACKEKLAEEFHLLRDHPHWPILGIVSRFADQKGFDLIAAIAHDLMHEDILLAVLGTGL